MREIIRKYWSPCLQKCGVSARNPSSYAVSRFECEFSANPNAEAKAEEDNVRRASSQTTDNHFVHLSNHFTILQFQIAGRREIDTDLATFGDLCLSPFSKNKKAVGPGRTGPERGGAGGGHHFKSRIMAAVNPGRRALRCRRCATATALTPSAATK